MNLTMRHAQFAVLGLIALLAAFGLLPGDVLAGVAGVGVMMGEMEIKDLPKLVDELKKTTDQCKAIAEDFKGKYEAGEKVSKEAKEVADNALSKLNELTAQVKEVEQKMARFKLPAAGGGDDETKSLGTQFIESESFKKLAESASQRGKAEIAVKATLRLDNATPDTPGNTGMLVEPTRLPGIQQNLRRRLVVRDLLAQGQMTGNSIEYLQESGFTNNANMVAEEALKPQSDISFTERSTSARVIAHNMKATRQILSDAPQLRAIIDERLLYGLALKEEQQLLNGDGIGQNLLGIIPQAIDYAPAPELDALVTFDDVFGRLRLAMLQAILAEYPATGHVLHPIDWTRFELAKDDLGRYIIGNPQGSTQPTLWNLPVVVTQAITLGKFLTGAFRPSAQVFDRWAARVELATENEDDFVKNRVTVQAEERLAMVVYRPEGFIYGDLVGAAPPP